MPLIKQKPDPLPADRSRHERVRYVSPADGSQQLIDVYAPADSWAGALPLVLGPHPITWTAEENYHGGWSGYMCGYHDGFYNLAEKYAVLIAVPHGHHRHEPHCSLASPEQIVDLASMATILQERGYNVDEKRVYICGLSMGGQEALVAAGRHPERFAAAVAFNPIVDLAAWHDDMASHPDPDIRAFNTAATVAREVGGTPDDKPDLYAERSATTYVKGLSLVPTLIYWSEKDIIVPNQLTRHTYPLYQRVKAVSSLAPIAEYNHTAIHGLKDFSAEECFQLHEWCDYELAVRWMLNHCKA